MEIVYASRNHLHPNLIPPGEKYFDVMMEEEEDRLVKLPDLSVYGRSALIRR